jgi:putative DNA primase/helicase
MSQPTSKNELDLDAGAYLRFHSWMPEFAAELSDSTKVRRVEDGVRIGRQGSLSVSYGGWYSFEADEGGRDPLSLLRFLRPDAELGELRRFAIEWLRTHPGMGSGGQITETAPDYSGLVRQVLKHLVPTTRTLAQVFLESRGIHGDWPISLVGYVSDDARPGEGAIVGVITDQHGIPAGVQVGFLDAAGRKVEVGGAERRQFLIDRQAPGLRFHVAPMDVDPALPVFVVEGLENSLALAMAYPMAEVIGLPGIGRMKRLPPFVDRDVVVFRDGDENDAPATRALLTGIDHLLIGGAKVRVTNTPADQDANSLLQYGGKDAIKAIVDGASPATLSPKGIVEKLAAMPEFDYQLVRRQHAKTLGVKYSALDEQVYRARARRRGEAEESEDDPDIHPEPVDDIAAVLDIARAEVGLHIVADPLQLDMAVMWSLHSHFVHHSTIDIAISPRLLISAPAPECGKTTALECIGEMTAKPMELSSISAAAFYRLSDAERPCLLIDEIGGMVGRRGGNPELEGILNASHRRRSAKTVRVEEQISKQGARTLKATTFNSWCTFAATLNGRLPYALESRCLKLKMRRALAGEVKQHLQYGTSELLVECRRKFARWAMDQVALPNVSIPEALSNRRGDNWAPLFRIAALVGGHWPAKIEAAALAAIKQTASTDAVVALLADARKVIGERERILTAELIDGLRAVEDPSWDWNTCHRGGPINAYWLRDALADVLDPPGTREWKVAGRTRIGYTADQFRDAYRRYLQSHAPEPAAGVEKNCEEGGISGKTSNPSATGTKKPNLEQQFSSVADAGMGAKGYRRLGVSATDKVADQPGRRYQKRPSSPSATGKKSKQDQEKIVPVADEADQTRKRPTSRTNSQSPPGPQPQGEGIDELW